MSIMIPDASALKFEHIQSQIRRFAPALRRRLWALSAKSARLRELLYTFPAAGVAIVSRGASDPGRGKAIDAVESGLALSEVAAALGLPGWFRKLPPEAFRGPLAGCVLVSTVDPGFGAKALNLMPDSPASTGWWFSSLMSAHVLADDAFALWVAAQPAFRCRVADQLPLLPLGLFAWYSRHPEFEAARSLTTLWSPRLGLSRAALETRRWLHDLLQDKCLGAVSAIEERETETIVNGFEFVALVRPSAIVEEGRAMQNCLAQYVEFVICGHSYLFSIRSKGQRVACLEVRIPPGKGVPVIHQLCGPRNTVASAKVHEAAVAWLAQSEAPSTYPGLTRFDRQSNEAFDRHVWQPYAQAMRKVKSDEMLPQRPPVSKLVADLRALWILAK